MASRINRTPTLNNIWTISGTNAAGGLGDHASKLITNKIGPNMLLKVMAGDKLTMKADYFYNQPYNNTASNLTSTIADAIAVLLGSAISPASQAVKGSGVQIQGTLSNGSGPLAQFLQNQNNNTTASPRAYLNYLFFDESFRFVPYDQTTGLGSYGLAVINSGDGQWLGASNVKVPKNGYVFVYLSNSSNIDVYFDNLDITHIRGRLIEENAYYPYGLKAKGICGEAFGKLDTKFGYQGEYAEEDDETGWNEFDLRMYNPQIGRWNGVDPYDEFASPYVGMGTNPANFADPNGGGILDSWGTLVGAVAGMTAGIIWANNGDKNNEKTGVGFGKVIGSTIAGALIGYFVDDIFNFSSLNFVPRLDETEVINVVIHHGSKVNDEGAGGKAGGHVTVNFGDDQLYGFTGWSRNKNKLDADGNDKAYDIPLLPTRDANGEWYSEIHGNENSHNSMSTVLRGEDELTDDDLSQTYGGAGVYSIFKIKVSKAKFDKIHNWYKTNLNKSPYPYTLLGKRCTSSLFNELKKNHIIPKKIPLSSFFHAFNPGALFRYLKKLGYEHQRIIQPGGIPKEDIHKYNFYGEN